LPPRPYLYPTLLPDGQQVIVEIEEQPHSIWHADLRSGALTRLTYDTPSHRPTVSRDGRMMAFSSDRVVPRSLFLQATDGSGAAERLTQAGYSHNATSISPDGRWLAFTESHAETKTDIWVLPLQGDRRPVAFLNTTSSEHSAAFSPDGQWIAYVSDESGREEVLISAFPGPGPRKEISTGGGEMPLFSHDGRTLFYRSGNHVMAADIVTRPTLTSSAPRVAFDMPWGVAAAGLPNFAITETGDALLAVKDAEREPGPPKVHVVVNWFEELRRLTAAK
jgi:Tol biopolymer transport system component